MVEETNKQYHSNPAVSKSTLSRMSVNPFYYKWCLENPQEKTDDLIIGSAFHKLVLEPETFADEFLILPICNRRTKDGKALYDTYLEEAIKTDRELVSQEDYENICKMRDAIYSNKYTKALLKGDHEKSFYWTDTMTGIDCKCRPDSYRTLKDRIVICDLKSCRSADMQSIERDVVSYAYDLQAYMYAKGLSLNLGVPMDKIDFLFLFCEKKEPYMCNIVQANEYVMQRGENLFREYIGTLKYCRDTDNWYGYEGVSGQPNELSLPYYLIKELDEKGE